MLKPFCDICDEPMLQDKKITHRVFNNVKLVEDLSPAKIRFILHQSYIAHPNGDGGQPDLCKKCFYSLLEDFLECNR